jgi:hypothetical protein
MRIPFVCVCAIMLVASMSPVQAGDRVGIGVKAGTLGLGVDVTGRVTNWFSIRGSFNTADVSTTDEVSDIEYDGDVALGAYGLLLDLHPFKNNFRLSVGFMRNRTGIDLTGQTTEDTQIGDNTYTPDEIGTLTGAVEFKEDVPYFGLGYGSAAKGPHRVKFLLDLGVLSQGAGEVSLSSSTGLVLQSDLEQEVQEIEEDIEDYDLWPVLALGISFRI